MGDSEVFLRQHKSQEIPEGLQKHKKELLLRLKEERQLQLWRVGQHKKKFRYLKLLHILSRRTKNNKQLLMKILQRKKFQKQIEYLI